MTTLDVPTFTLRDYQEIGVEFMRENKRVMNTDKAGIGKTAQATFAAEVPVLVIAPNYLVDHWDEWLRSLNFDVVAARGTRQERLDALEAGAKWTVINVEMLQSFKDYLEKNRRRWRTVIIDESHHLKSHKGIRAKTAVKLCKDTEYVFLLTATPIKRELDDLFMQFRILQPDIFTSYWRFVSQFCVVEENYFGTQILGAKKSMLPDLHRLMDIFVIGRDYKDVGRQLPPIIEKYLHIELNTEVRKLYNEITNYWRVQIQQAEENNVAFTNYMEIMHNLRQHLTGSLKVDAIKSLMEDVSDETDTENLIDVKRSTVFFSWYKNTANAVSEAVANCGLVTGDVKDVQERRRIALTSHNVSATISALSEGIDLSRARTVVFAEEDWTPGSNYQALARVDRERQNESNDEPVIVYYVHCKNTIDEQIHRYSKVRGATAKEVVRDALYL